MLHAALTVFVLGVEWRFVALARLPTTLAVAPAGREFSRSDALGTALTRMWPHTFGRTKCLGLRILWDPMR